MIYTLNHNSGRKCWYNSITKKHTLIPESVGFMANNGDMYQQFNSINSFLESELKECVICVYCISIKKKGKRKFFSLASEFGHYEFFNVEMGQGWINHKMDEMIENEAYRILLKRNSSLLNDVQVIYSKKLNQD